MKKIIATVILTAAVGLLCACSPAEDDNRTTAPELSSAVTQQADAAVTTAPGEPVEPEETRREWLEASEPQLSEGAYAYKEISFSCNGGEGLAALYTTAERDEAGEIMWDDANSFACIVSIGERSFTLLPEESIQLGEPYLSVFEDEEGLLHLILTDSRTAQYCQYLFIYDAESGRFAKETLLDYTSCNYWGTI